MTLSPKLTKSDHWGLVNTQGWSVLFTKLLTKAIIVIISICNMQCVMCYVLQYSKMMNGDGNGKKKIFFENIKRILLILFLDISIFNISFLYK